MKYQAPRQHPSTARRIEPITFSQQRLVSCDADHNQFVLIVELPSGQAARRQLLSSGLSRSPSQRA
jgi:hypothetical protein